MIIYGTTKSEIAQKMGITKQALFQRIQRHPEALFINVEEARYELDTDKLKCKIGRKGRVNFKKSYTGAYITRFKKEKKYKKSVYNIPKYIKSGVLLTNEDGSLVSDTPI